MQEAQIVEVADHSEGHLPIYQDSDTYANSYLDIKTSLLPHIND
jgi:hypothetical protein